MGPVCTSCEHIHSATDTVAEGRFDPDGPTGYRARHEGAPLRPTRNEADRDACIRRRTAQTGAAS